MGSRRLIIAVIGGATVHEEAAQSAYELGRQIAQRGFNLVCGGGSGVMEAACKGFAHGRNLVDCIGLVSMGICPGNNAKEANEYVDIVIPTGIGIARNAIIARMADGVISVSGCSGTLSEIAYAWQMEKPIVAMENTGGWSEKLAGNSIDERRRDVIYAAADALEALDYLESVLQNDY